MADVVAETSSEEIKFVTADDRGRVSVGRPNAGFLMRVGADGVLVLEPAQPVSELEMRYLRNAALQAKIDYARAHPEQAQPRRRRSHP